MTLLTALDFLHHLPTLLPLPQLPPSTSSEGNPAIVPTFYGSSPEGGFVMDTHPLKLYLTLIQTAQDKTTSMVRLCGRDGVLECFSVQESELPMGSYDVPGIHMGSWDTDDASSHPSLSLRRAILLLLEQAYPAQLEPAQDAFYLPLD
ncbi:uncharacterized protein EV420DRAFT_1645938 [Desarmillaria tabescens]|uniref:Uncharacterized protein n=1 Tax=Armillaria tabescens TaxID=1929756 RepID=A0AA39MZL1_ARMTA|nr:uncharacterized protein EV420DRAFT_1645938 [Desarmillaria tabescens]KAK0451998.1 hypothetical protein EV420DRAFT_1645938 [Desarmillaria tabescens]